MPIRPEEAAAAVRLARTAIESAFVAGSPRDAAEPFRTAALPPLFDEKRGVFVTLKRASDDALRGCIGYPLPVERLRAAIPHVATSAAFEDPRFRPVRQEELRGLTVEVSILTVPRPMAARSPAERLHAVVVGRDGLIIESQGASGLLLPHVAVEEGWDSAMFLAGVCHKAGLALDAWQDLASRLFTFQAEVFGETAPGGAVVLVPLTPAPGGSVRRE